MNDTHDQFSIGGETLYSSARAAGPNEHETLEDVRLRVGTLLKAETVSFLLGAGASVDCGGVLLGSVPIEIEKAMCEEGVSGKSKLRVQRWLKAFYLGARHAGSANIPATREEILERKEALDGQSPQQLDVNFERVLATLHRWRSALPANGKHRLRVEGVGAEGNVSIDITTDDLDKTIHYATRALAGACNLPTNGKEAGVSTHKAFLRKVLTRPLNLKRANVFTLNYDTLIEQAADAEGIVLIEGFVGAQRRVFRPESYEQDLYFPAETTEGRVHRLDRVLHLYKLHGSITWVASDPTIDNPYGVESKLVDPATEQRLLIYPTPAKYGETLGMPYAELFRRFANAIVRPQSVLFVIGYGFGDDHVNMIVRQALAVPSFTLVIVDPSPQSPILSELQKQKDGRVWIATGPTLGTFKGFVEQVLPDLRDEEITKKVLATHRALSRVVSESGGTTDGD